MAHLSSNIPWYYNKLTDCCCRLTEPRKAILDVLNKTDNHLNAKQIYRIVSKIYPKVGLATIYRNLELLVRLRLIWKLDTGDNKTRYELAEGPGTIHHHHLICKKCNKIRDYSETIDDEKEFLKNKERKLSRKYNFKIEGHFIDFFGLCSKCLNKG